MKLKILISGALALMLVSGCGVSESDYNNLKVENERLNTELDECKFGAEKIVSQVKQAYEDKNYDLARNNITLLSSKHPEASENDEFKTLLVEIEKNELEQKKKRAALALEHKKKKAAEIKERKRIANLNNTGIWQNSFFVDKFGEATNEPYITTDYIGGTFSNTATENSKLNVNFLIPARAKIALQLFEYAGKNPVKNYGGSAANYSVLVKDKNNKRYELIAQNWSERLYFIEKDSLKLHDILMKGGNISFRITEDKRRSNQYSFTIKNADWYNHAYTKLKAAYKRKG